jgi:hypothetical protein
MYVLRPEPQTHLLPFHTVHVYTVYLFTQGRGGGGELNQKEGERCNRGKYISHSWAGNTNMTECAQELAISIL